jgi:hypothetical protein
LTNDSWAKDKRGFYERKLIKNTIKGCKFIMGNKEHGLYMSSTPSSAARKAVTKLCAANKSKKVEFYMREITQDSKKKTYGLKKFVKRIFLNFNFYFTLCVK